MDARTLTSRKGKTVVTTLTDNDALAAISCMTTNEFARKLWNNHKKYGLSDDQMVWVHVLAMGDTAPPEAINVGCMNGLIEIFDRAKVKLKYPKIRLTMPNGKPLCISVAGDRSKYPGQLNVTDGEPFGRNIYYGRIARDGVFAPSNSGTPAGLVEFLMAFAADPAKVAAEYGRLSGNCCFCNTKLDDERSTAAGYGPVCAKNYGLSWGKKAAAEHTDLQEVAS